ncbi:MAG: hypothetical protein L3K02_09215 [Thermoplasmata archaeon]|nr:hypothetical protein [Thermoplasmata archaeon]
MTDSPPPSETLSPPSPSPSPPTSAPAAVPPPGTPAPVTKPAVPPPTSAPPKPAVSAGAPPVPIRIPRSGDLQDRGVARRDSVHAVHWSVEGTVKVTGDVDVGNGTIRGALSVGGAISADAFASRGTLDSGAAITVVGTLSTDGSLHTIGPVQAGVASFSGTTRIRREVAVDRVLTVTGQFAAPSVRAGEFHGDGAVEVPGTLDATTVDVKIRGDGRFGTIRARSVRLVRTPPNPIQRIFGRSPATPVVRIEAEKAELEGVDVAFIRCPEVILGRDAHVTEIEGTVVRRHSSARVGPRSQSPPPYGLSR